MTTQDDNNPDTVEIAGAVYRMTESVRFSTALDISTLLLDGPINYYQAAALALYERCPTLRSRLGLGEYSGNPRAFGAAVLDALVDPSRRGGKAQHSTSRATPAEVYRAIGAAMLGATDILGGGLEVEVEAAAGNSDATP